MRLRAVSYFSLDTVDCEQALWASGEAARNEGWLVYFSPYISVLVLVFLFSLALLHNSDGVTGLFSLKQCTLFPLEVPKKCCCESVSLTDVSVLFHRRVALEWNVPAWIFLALRRDKIISSWGSRVVIMATLDIVNIGGKIFWTRAIADFMEKR